MSDATLRDLGRRVRDQAGDPEVLRGLALLAARSERLPEEATPARVLPGLAALWREDPDDRRLEALLLALLGAELPPGDAPHVPRWFVRKDRARVLEGRAYDLRQGFPLRLRRRRDGGVMVLVPGGSMARGTDDLGDECGPPHQVHLEAFYLDRRSVSRGQYEAFLRAHGRPARLSGRGDPDDPATGMTWADAQAYCAWVGGRLPTEAEYEKAMRGPYGWRYPWGDRRLVAVEAADSVAEVADRLVDQPELQRSSMGRLFGEVLRQGARRVGREASTRWEDPEFQDESLFGLLGVDAPHFDWVDDWYQRDAYRDAVGRCPRPAAPPRPSGRRTSPEEIAAQAMGEFDNRHDEAPPGMSERVYQEALREAREAQRLEQAKVIRQGSPSRSRARGGRGQGGWRPCAQRSAQPMESGRADLGFRVAFSAARAPTSFPPPGTEKAKPMKRRAPPTPEPAARPRGEGRGARGRGERNPFAELTSLALDVVDRLRDDD